MKVAIQKWGNSLAVRIPKAFADDLGVCAGSVVDVSVLDGRLIAAPRRREKVHLADLLSGVTPANRHDEIATGEAAGGEAW